MARRSNTDAIRELERNLAVLKETLENLLSRVDQVEHGLGHTIDRVSSGRSALLSSKNVYARLKIA